MRKSDFRGVTNFIRIAFAITVAAVLTAILPPVSAVAADPAHVDLQHWADLSGKWVNGNLNQSNSTYAEDDSVPNRFVISNLQPGKDYTLTLRWQTTKAARHATDYLTDYNASEATVTGHVCDLLTCGAGPTWRDFPASLPDSNPTSLPTINPNPLIPPPVRLAAWNVTDNGTFSIDTPYGTLTNCTGSGASGTYGSTTCSQFVIHFRAANATNPVVFAWGGHLALDGDWDDSPGAGDTDPNNDNNGACDINGSPYHWIFQLVQDGDTIAQGGRQRSVKCTDSGTSTATLTVKKVCVPSNPFDTFDFSASPTIADLDLQDLSCGDDRSSSVTPGTLYTFTELFSPTSGFGWELRDVTCTDDVTQSSIGTEDLLNHGIKEVSVASGQSVTCTFSNYQAQMPLHKLINGESATCTPAEQGQTGDQGVRPCTYTNAGLTLNAADPRFAINLYLTDPATFNPGDLSAGRPLAFATNPPSPNPGAFPLGYLAQALIPPMFEAPGLINVPLTLCEVPALPYKLDSVSVVITPSGSQTATVYDNSGYRCFNILIPEGTTKFEISINNAAAKLKVTKILVPSVDSGQFTLKIDGAAYENGAADSTGVGDAGTTGFIVVPASTGGTSHTVSEGAVAPTNLGDYGSVIGGACATDGTVTLNPGESKECTITNTRNATLIVQKTTVGGVGTFDFTSASSALPSPAVAGAFFIETVAANTPVGKTFNNLTPGTAYGFSETVPGAWDLTNIHCEETVAGAGGSNIPADHTTQPTSVTLAAGATVTCTFTDRKKATIVVIKDAQPDGPEDFAFTTTGAGLSAFDLDDDGNNAGDNSAIPDSLLSNTKTFSNLTPNAAYSVTEGAETDFDLTGLSCVSALTTSTFADGVVGGNRKANINNLTPGDTVTCTFTNKRKPILTVVKNCVPITDTGRFNLYIGSAAPYEATKYNVPCVDNPATTDAVENALGPKVLSPNTYLVSESGYSPTVLSDYDSTLSCKNNVDNSSHTVSPNNGTSGSVALAYGEDVTCTFVNSRKARLAVKKMLDPTTDTGKFDLKIDSTSYGGANGFGHNQGTGSVNVTNAVHSVQELGHGTTPLSNYITDLACTNATVGGTDVSSVGGTNVNSANAFNLPALTYGDNVSCTFTNHRRPELKVVKVLFPAGDGLFDLYLDSPYTNNNNGYGNGGNTGFQTVSFGTHTAGEAGHGTTLLTDYLTSISCDNSVTTSAVGAPNNGGLQWTVNLSSVANFAGKQVTCTITNTRRGVFTDSMLCNGSVWDKDPARAGDQFRLIYISDTATSYRLNASNPGQFYYNVFIPAAPAGGTDVTLNIPWPFITQGAQPVHAYSAFTTSNGASCINPTGSGTPFSNAIVAGDYAPQGFSVGNPLAPDSTKSITVHVPQGTVYVNIHLDYGLKGVSNYTPSCLLSGSLNLCSPGSGPNAINTTATNSVPYLALYGFSDSLGGSDSVESENVFKNDPGIAGLVQKAGTTDPIAGATVKIYNGTSLTAANLAATLTTDSDGWYQWLYKYTGKAATFTIQMTPPAGLGAVQTQSVTLKSNGFLIVNFLVP